MDRIGKTRLRVGSACRDGMVRPEAAWVVASAGIGPVWQVLGRRNGLDRQGMVWTVAMVRHKQDWFVAMVRNEENGQG